MDINKLSLCLENAGVYADICNSESDIDLQVFITSSLQFIAIIVSIEETFGIEFPDELLVIETFASLNTLISIIDSLTKQAKIIPGTGED